MFEIEFIEDKDYKTWDVQLKYTDQSLSLTLEPEYPEYISKLNLETDQQFNTSPSNGNFSIDWQSDQIILSVAKYGDGNGGFLIVRILKTQPVLESLMKCLRQWQAAFSK